MAVSYPFYLNTLVKVQKKSLNTFFLSAYKNIFLEQNIYFFNKDVLHVRPHSCRVKPLKLKLLRVTVCWTGQRSDWLGRPLAPTSWNLLNRNFNQVTGLTLINKDWRVTVGPRSIPANSSKPNFPKVPSNIVSVVVLWS